MVKLTEKFQFTTDYQLDLLKFTVLDRDGYKALELYEDSYFTLLEHAVIALALKGFYKKKHKVPGLSILKEELNEIFKKKDFVQSLTSEDRTGIMKIVDDLYKGQLRDGEEILNRCAKWASFVELKHEIESVNLLDFSAHEAFSNKILRAISKGNPVKEQRGTFLIRDLPDRQLSRSVNPPITPTPFKQINKLTNAGGYPNGSIIVLLDKPKSLKTLALMNVAAAYAKSRLNVFIADLENGEGELSLRLEQNLMKEDKATVLSGDIDSEAQKLFKRFTRLGIDIYIRRFPSGTTANEIGAEMDKIYRDTGIRFPILVVDYIALMGCINRTDDETERINRAYLDVGNLCLRQGILHCWTANHIQRSAEKRMNTRYQDTDIAKCIDIIRHAQAIFGLNRSEEEIEDSLIRMELVMQRDGVPKGRAVFKVDPRIQKITELSHQERKEYDANFGKNDDGEDITTRKYKGDIDK